MGRRVRPGVAVTNEARRIQAVLFDLDGTLNGIDMEKFLPMYFGALASFVADLIDPERFGREVWRATEALIQDDDPSLTNLEKWHRAFLPEEPDLADRLWPRFEAFYREGFDRLRRHAPHSPHARSVVEAVRSMGMRVAVATNPVFPEAAIRRRLVWAGLGDVPFALVTTLESMHFCKPNLRYYGEICERLELPPEACLMAGNDREEDMVAGRAGLATFWVTDHAIDRGKGRDVPTGAGPLEGLPRWLERFTDGPRGASDPGGSRVDLIR